MPQTRPTVTNWKKSWRLSVSKRRTRTARMKSVENCGEQGAEAFEGTITELSERRMEGVENCGQGEGEDIEEETRWVA